MNKILSILSGKNTDDSIIYQGFVGNSQQNAGCFIKTSEVYSICKGTVISVEQDPSSGHWAVTVEIDSQHWIRYCELGAIKVKSGQDIDIYDHVGYGYKNLMRLEYCTSETSQFPVRILLNQLYKQDPSPVLFSDDLLYEDE